MGRPAASSASSRVRAEPSWSSLEARWWTRAPSSSWPIGRGRRATASSAPWTLLRSPGWVPLARAFELDGAPGFETFALITSSEPLDPRSVVERGCAEEGVRFTLRKDRAPRGRR
jgi:hypothetical protein